MIIKTLTGKEYNVAFDELYIKPFYEGDKVTKYCICNNERNTEIILADYSNLTVAKHMLHLMATFLDSSLPVNIRREIDLCEDMWVAATYRLEKARRIKGEMVEC
jgi:hypothetical protein